MCLFAVSYTHLDVYKRQEKEMKKMEKTIEVRDDLANYVESLQYEVNSMMAIMSFMLDRDMDTSTEAFQNWNRKYTEAYASYEAAKAELERDYIKSCLLYTSRCV